MLSLGRDTQDNAYRSSVGKSVFGRVVDDVEQSGVRIVKVDFGVEVGDLELQDTSGELLVELAENNVLSFLGLHGLCEHLVRKRELVLLTAGKLAVDSPRETCQRQER